jgi:methionyl-tRNA formyltransferase
MTNFANGLKRLLVFGVNETVCDVVRYCQEYGIEVFVFSSPRMRSVKFPDGSQYEGFATCNEWIRAQGVCVHEHKKIDVDILSHFRVKDFAGFSIGSPFLFDQSIIDFFEDRFFNSHGSRLPNGKGGGGFSWRIMENDREGAVVFHMLTEGIDDGPIVRFQPFRFSDNCRKPIDFLREQTLRNRPEIKQFLCDLAENRDIDLDVQATIFSSYFPRLNTARQAFIDWRWPVADIEKFVLAFSDPYEGAKTFLNGSSLFIKDCYVDRKGGPHHPYKVGIIYNIYENNLYCCCLDATLVITEFSQAKRAGPIVGDRLYTPASVLEKLIAERVFYNPSGLKNLNLDEESF